MKSLCRMLLVLVVFGGFSGTAKAQCGKPAHHGWCHCAIPPRPEIVESVAIRRVAAPMRNDVQFSMIPRSQAAEELTCSASKQRGDAAPAPPEPNRDLSAQLQQIQSRLDDLRALTLAHQKKLEELDARFPGKR